MDTPALEYPDYIVRLRADTPELADEFAGFTGIEEVLQWMQRRGLCSAPVDMVGQDEFSYDFLLQFDPDGRWLAFGVN